MRFLKRAYGNDLSPHRTYDAPDNVKDVGRADGRSGCERSATQDRTSLRRPDESSSGSGSSLTQLRSSLTAFNTFKFQICARRSCQICRFFWKKKRFSAYSEGCLLALTHLFDWACLARTCTKFLTFSDACFSLPVGHMLHLFSIISLMLLSDCFACCVALKWHSASYSVYFFFLHLFTLLQLQQ